MKVLLFSMPDVIPQIAKREWEAPNLGLSSIAGNSTAGRDFGAHPRMDSATEPAFLSTRDLRWSRRLKTVDQAATL